MRISTNTLYQNGLSRLSQLQVDQDRLMQQISSKKRILTPADDPVGAARSLELQNSQRVNTQFERNRMFAENSMNAIEGNLQGVTDLLIAAKARLAEAGNASYDDVQRSYIAIDLQNDLEALVALANAQDGSGNYLYAGYSTDTAPYTLNAGGATYNGDNQVRQLQVSANRQLPVAENGPSVFQANGNDVFAALATITDLLQTPVTSPADAQALQDGLAAASDALQGTLDNVLTVRARNGSALKEIEALNSDGSSRDLQYAKSLSELQDLDYAKALSDLAKQQTVLEAAQKAFVATTSLSLFNLI
ncbi:flagellar hook-associated protein FlgL [Methylobacillus flagellatus]|uniref:Flagellin-like protein n=1 Tax=Methylobacillus flagellatus (strain ATCC 51484 / DSM 6875 / VKM B-1610 / KT) TaxID=265072 RepID=Q1GZV6_METFK|nr:flagellar hook-associated protein FlgL [Methylobacillus flagellatus]ABE50231.1 flagellin-like protein [Methylobacillus flagellatus KT]